MYPKIKKDWQVYLAVPNNNWEWTKMLSELPFKGKHLIDGVVYYLFQE